MRNVLCWTKCSFAVFLPSLCHGNNDAGSFVKKKICQQCYIKSSIQNNGNISHSRFCAVWCAVSVCKIIGLVFFKETNSCCYIWLIWHYFWKNLQKKTKCTSTSCRKMPWPPHSKFLDGHPRWHGLLDLQIWIYVTVICGMQWNIEFIWTIYIHCKKR